MQMLTKFESKSSRAKGVAFHPKRPWILVSLHSSTIQLWDYRMGTLIDRFEDHDGPVRGVDFHKTQPLFVSGGDDYNIKVWSLTTRKCLFTLTGHLDYIRTVFFHEELPWIISASDDQTIRIWNWQNRQEIACLTGHNHYIMCAQFHPKEDLIVSASLDQTVRVWDISGLRKKHSAPSMNSYSFEDQLARANSIHAANQAAQQDIFGNTDAVVKYVLEGHDRGVNWASFHPTLPLIVSGGDDRVLKVWRMSETKAWELDTCRGHLNNILCCIFHPYQDMIISVGEDKTIRTWDLNKRTPIHQFKRESDRFWNIASHNSLNLFAACHDSGVMVFKLERERPASAVYQNSLFFINNENQVKYFDSQSEKESLPLLSLKKIAPAWEPFRDMSYNPAERCLLLTTKSEATGSNYQLVNLPKDVSGAIEPTGVIKGAGDQAIFVARNRFVVFTKSEQTLDIKDLANSTTKTIKTPFQVRDIAYGGPGLILLLSSATVALYDVQQKKLLATVAAAGVKYVVWSADNQYVALLSKHAITIANKSLDLISSLHETIRIKSATWDDASNVLIYSTLNHMKFSLLNGDTGIIKTLDNTVYLSKVKGNKVFCLARGGKVETIIIDPTEYRFKRALVKKDFKEVLRIITNSNLVGQSIISYLQQKGYPEVALQFVQQVEIKFELALECGNLAVALEQAKIIDKKPYWTRLATEALSQGNIEIVELVYQKQHHFDKLSFLYMISGNKGKLDKMSSIAQHRGDYASWVQNTIYTNDIESRIQALRDTGMGALAYATAKSNGLAELAQEILDENELTANQVKTPTVTSSIPVAPPIAVETYKSNWPLRSAALSFFEQAIVGQLDNVSLDDSNIPAGASNTTTTAAAASDAFFQHELENEDEDETAGSGGWGFDDEDLGIDDLEDVVTDTDGAGSQVDITPGANLSISEVDLWIRNSPVAADHIAAGSFETAAQLLNRQVGVVNFAPLKSRMMQVYKASRAYLPTAPGMSSLPVFIRRDIEETEGSLLLPMVPGYESLSAKLQLAYKKVWANEPEAAIALFREIIHTILILAVSTQEDADECLKLLGICKEYILAFSIELERRALDPTDIKRNLELAAYFTRLNLQSAHMAIPYHVAMIQSFKNKNFSSASYFANKLLEIGGNGTSRAEQSRAEQARKIKAKSDLSPLDAVDIDFDPFTDFDICPASFTPIYPGSPFEKDPLTGAKYQPSYKGKVCEITQVTMVGAPASGLRLYI